MIRIEIQGETADVVQAEMRKLLGGTAPIAASAPPASATKETESKAPAKRGKSAAAPAETAPAEPAAQTTSDTDVPSDPAELRKFVEPKCLAFSTKGGAQALKELFIEHGSAEGKWTKVPDENLPALNARLDELLAA